jgi:hypothetical protein
LDFVSDNCIWCQRLDASTFRDPNVVALLNAKFVPVKIDGHQDERLTQALAVTGFPTLILAAPDGKVLARKNGYIDAAGLTAMLAQANSSPPLAQTPQSGPQSPAAAALRAALQDYDAGRYLACLERCRKVRTDHAGSPDADEAARLTARVVSDPTTWQRACEQMTERLESVRPVLASP